MTLGAAALSSASFVTAATQEECHETRTCGDCRALSRSGRRVGTSDGAAARAETNVVFIMADDLGNADLGYRGGEVRTPNIDQLANSGVRLESSMGNPSVRRRAQR